jgi:chemotaxis regulatin CheY-phosphate phosphatase CheZ
MENRENARYILLVNVNGRKAAVQVDGLYSILPPQNFPLHLPKEIQHNDERLPLYDAKEVLPAFDRQASREGSYEKLYKELLTRVKEVSDEIVQLKKNIAGSTEEDLAHLVEEKGPATSGELSSILEETERAASSIMDLTEAVQKSHLKLSEKFDVIKNCLTEITREEESLAAHLQEMGGVTSENSSQLSRIMTSLSRHDLMGQKVQELRAVEEELEKKLISILVNFGIRMRKEENPNDETVKRGERMLDLLQGADREAIDQEEVDHLLAEFLK